MNIGEATFGDLYEELCNDREFDESQNVTQFFIKEFFQPDADGVFNSKKHTSFDIPKIAEILNQLEILEEVNELGILELQCIVDKVPSRRNSKEFGKIQEDDDLKEDSFEEEAKQADNEEEGNDEEQDDDEDEDDDGSDGEFNFDSMQKMFSNNLRNQSMGKFSLHDRRKDVCQKQKTIYKHNVLLNDKEAVYCRQGLISFKNSTIYFEDTDDKRIGSVDLTKLEKCKLYQEGKRIILNKDYDVKF